MRDTPAYSILAGNFFLWSCVFGTFIVEDTLLGISDKKIIRYFLSYEGLFSESRLYIYWSGQVVETQEKHLLVIIHIIINHLVVIVFDVLAFHLYQKIQDRQTENPKPNDKEDFHNIMDLTENCSQSVNRCDQVEDNRHRHHNFVPWHIHRQVLLCTTVASTVLILAFIFISKFFDKTFHFFLVYKLFGFTNRTRELHLFNKSFKKICNMDQVFSFFKEGKILKKRKILHLTKCQNCVKLQVYCVSIFGVFGLSMESSLFR